MGSFLTPDEARHGRELIEAAATDAGRAVEPDHYGINVAVAENGLSDEVVAAVRKRRPDVDPTELIADGWPRLHQMIDGYLAAGLTKFVIRPAGGGNTDEFIDRFAAELLPREN